MKNFKKIKIISNQKSKYSLLLLIFIIYNLTYNIAKSQIDSTDPYALSFNQLKDIAVTSPSKVPQKINEVPSTVYIITSEQIKTNGYFTLEEALSDLPGFQFRNILSYNSYVFQRGIPNQNNLTLVLIDGVQINELNSGGFYAGGQYNLSNVDRIEVIYGPASVAYGTNAVTGIINIITKSALENKIEANVLYGTFNTLKSDINYSYSNEKKTFGISLSGMIKKSDKADLKGKAGDYNWTDKMDNFENDYAFDLKVEASDFTFGTNYQYKQASTAASTKSVGTIYSDHGTSWNIQFINNYLKYKTSFTKDITFSSMIYNRNASVLDNTIYYVVDTAQIGYFRPNNLTGFENIINYNISNQFSTTGGLIIEYEQLSEKASLSFSNSPDVRPPVPATPKQINNYLISAFIEPRLTLFDNLYLSGGVRFDESSIYNEVLTPRAGLTYNFKNQVFRFSYAEAYRAPKPWDYTDGLGNNSLLPEKMNSLESAINLSFGKLKFDIIGYKNFMDNTIVKEIINNSYRWVNSGKLKTDGVELYLRYSTSKLDAIFNYTYNATNNEIGIYIPEISKHTGNASLTYSYNIHFKINLRANYVGKRENPKLITTTNSRFIEPYLIFHAAISFMDYKGFDIQLLIKNLLNKEYYNTSNREPDRYRQPQRTILLSISYSFRSNK